MGQDYDRMAKDHIDDIDFYRWLRRQIDVGGAFHIPVPAASHAARGIPACTATGQLPRGKVNR
jgi:hypothetical protein